MGGPHRSGRDFIAVYLQSLPADAVESIEVIPNPSAAFQPDGSGGILNIVLRDNVELGIGGALTVGGDTQGGYQGNALVTFGRGPLRLSTTAAYRENIRDSDSDRLRINRFLGPDATELAQTSVDARTRTSALLGLSADLALTPQTTLNASVNGTVRGGGSEDETDLLIRDLEGGLLDSVLRSSVDDDDGLSGSFRLGLKHDFEGRERGVGRGASRAHAQAVEHGRDAGRGDLRVVRLDRGDHVPAHARTRRVVHLEMIGVQLDEARHEDVAADVLADVRPARIDVGDRAPPPADRAVHDGVLEHDAGVAEHALGVRRARAGRTPADPGRVSPPSAAGRSATDGVSGVPRASLGVDGRLHGRADLSGVGSMVTVPPPPVQRRRRGRGSSGRSRAGAWPIRRRLSALETASKTNTTTRIRITM